MTYPRVLFKLLCKGQDRSELVPVSIRPLAKLWISEAEGIQPGQDQSAAEYNRTASSWRRFAVLMAMLNSVCRASDYTRTEYTEPYFVELRRAG